MCINCEIMSVKTHTVCRDVVEIGILFSQTELL